MGTKPAQLQRGEIMWLRANGAQLRPGQQCWVLADLQKPGLSVHVHMDDGSGRPRDIQLEDPAGTRRWVTRGALVALGCATWFRESRVYRPSQQVRTLTPAQAAAAELADERTAVIMAGAPPLTPERMAVVAFQNSLDGIN